MVAFMYPKAGLSFEEIDKYWGKEHADVCLSVPLFKKNLLKYEQVRRRSPNEIYDWAANTCSYQFHLAPEVNAKVVKEGGVNPIPYVGLAIFEAESYEKIWEVFTDPEYFRVIVPDEHKFLDREKSSLVMGDFVVKHEQ
jgi:hypothetical protein